MNAKGFKQWAKRDWYMMIEILRSGEKVKLQKLVGFYEIETPSHEPQSDIWVYSL